MKTEFIPKFVMLLAGAIVCIISIVKKMDTTYSLEILLAVLILFYLIGCIARRIIEKVMISNRFMKEKSENSDAQEDIEEEKKEQEANSSEGMLEADES